MHRLSWKTKSAPLHEREAAKAHGLRVCYTWLTHCFLMLGLCILPVCLHAQQLNRVEYFWNTDPGFGNGFPLSVASVDSVNGIFTIPTVGLPPGIHTLYLRSRDSSGAWSVFSKRMVHIMLPDPVGITAAEYFIDTDPGYGNANPISIPSTPADSVQVVSTVPTTSLAPGLHTLYVRTRDALGNWSVFSKRMIHIDVPPPPPIVAAEYFIDTDPGFGNGIPLTITPGDSIVLTPGSIPTGTLSPGLHTVYFRAKGADGQWSVFSKRMIHIDMPPPPPIVAAEYYIDADPGFGNGIPIAVTPGDSISASFQVPTGSLHPGLHMIYVRTKDSNGKWSVFSKKLLYIDNPRNDTIVAAEYFVDSDPGFGNGTPIVITPGDSIDVNFSVPTSSLLIGPHHVYVRVKDSQGRWSVFSRDSFYVDNFNCAIYGKGAIQISGDTCAGSRITLKDLTASNSMVNSNDYTREWDIFHDSVIDFTPDSIVNYTFNQPGTYTIWLKVYQTSNPVCQEIITQTITIRRVDTTYRNISICSGDSVFAGGAWQKSSGTYSDLFTNVYGCDSSVITNLTVIPGVTPSVTLSASQTSFCSGTSVLFSASPVNGGPLPFYRWYVNGNLVFQGAGIGYQTYGTSSLLDNDIVTVEMTSGATCPTINPVVSNAIQVSVTPSVAASVTIDVDTNNFCYGTQATFSVVNVVNGGSNPQFTWYRNNTVVQTGGTSYVSANLSNGEFIRCTMTSDATCVNNNPVNSNTITMTVYPVGTPSVAIQASTNNVCYGTSITFYAVELYAGNNPTYQWYLNDSLVQSGPDDTYTNDSLNDGDQVMCVLTSDYPCRLADYDTSNTVTMSIIYNLPVSASITASSNNICRGSNVTFTASVTNGGSPLYQWYVNNVIVQSGSFFQYSSSTLSNGDSVWVIVTSSISCATNNPAVSNKIYMTVLDYDTASVSITASADTICEATNVIFTATGINPGMNPVYVWRRNSITVQSGSSPVYSSSTFTQGEVVTCLLYADHTCVTPYPAASNAITMTVFDTLMPSVSVTASQTTVCQQTNVDFSAVINNGGSNPLIEWLVNNNIVQTGGLTFSSSALQNLDQVRVRLTSDYVCPMQNPVTSVPITMTVLDSITPAVFIYHGPNPACPGNLISVFTSTITGGPSPLFEFRVNGMIVQSGTQNQYTSNSFNNGDVVQVTMTSNASCLRTPTAVSNTDTIIIQQSAPAQVSIQMTRMPQCTGDTIEFEASPINGGSNPVFTWKVNNTIVQSGFDNQFSSASLQTGDVVSCQMLSSLSCATNNPAQSNSISVQIPSTVTPSVNITVSSDTICQGTLVIFTASHTNGGSNPSFTWRVNGNIVQSGAGNQYASASLTQNDQVQVEMTSSLTCAAPATVLSNIITMTVVSSVTPSVTITASETNICTGTPVTFTASPVNGGFSPSYQWLINGNPAGTNSHQLTTASLNNGDQVYVRMTSSLGCASPATVSSNTIIMTVSPAQPASVSITASATNICAGQQVIFTAFPSNGGASPFYQWKVNGINAGTNNFEFITSTLNNGDSVSVVMTSSSVCASPKTTTSNVLVIQVNPVVSPSVTINASKTSICAGETVFFTATAVNGGPSPAYQWKINGVNVGANAPDFSTAALSNNDLVQVVLTSNAPCAQPSVVTSNSIPITVSPFSTTSRQVIICSGDSIYAGGAWQTASGIYRDTFNTPTGCDSIVITSLTVVQEKTTARMIAICIGDSFFVGGNWQTVSGIYYDTLVAAGGCDSIVITELNVSQTITTSSQVNICAGDSVYAGGAWQTTPGVYADTFPLAGGCDSIHVTVLYVTPAPVITRILSICQGDSVFVGGAYQTTAGTYRDTFTVLGCDSIVITTLRVLPGYTSSRQITICVRDSFYAGGSWQNTAGTYYDTLTANNGCDSIITTYLSVVANFFTSIAPAICIGDSFYAGGAYQQTSGIYYDTLTSSAGCDSVIETNLSVVSYFFVSVTENICDGEFFYAGGANQTTSGIYYDTLMATGGCDSIVETHLFVHPRPVVSFSGLALNYCSADAPDTLTGSPPGGVFTGPGISGNIFNPGIVPIGVPYTITYTFTDSLGCSNAFSRQVTVALSPTATFSGLDVEYCLNDPAVTMTPSSPAGVFTGPGVSRNTFVPYFAGPGIHHIIFTVPAQNGCDATSSQTVTVHPLPVVAIHNLSYAYCSNDPVVQVSTTPASGGLLEGPGITGYQFNPEATGSDGYTVVTFTYTDSNQCTNRVYHPVYIFPVKPGAFAEMQTEFCEDEPAVMLTAFPLGGVFSGPGISGTIFRPDLAGAGQHQIVYTVHDNNQCQITLFKTITVYKLPTVAILNLDATYCQNDPLVVLEAMPAGGIFSGPGIDRIAFNPALAPADSVLTIQYQYTDIQGCTNRTTQQVTVFSVPVIQITGVSNYYALSDEPVSLTGNPPGGVFTGPGVNGNMFTPQQAGLGEHTIIYHYTAPNGCDEKVKFVIHVGLTGLSFLPGKGINIYPNPFHSVLHIEVALDKRAEWTITLRNITGSRLLQKAFSLPEGESRISIQPSQLPSGVYFLELGDEEGRTHQHKVVKIDY